MVNPHIWVCDLGGVLSARFLTPAQDPIPQQKFWALPGLGHRKVIRDEFAQPRESKQTEIVFNNK